MLPKLTYLMFGRTIWLLALLARGDAAKDLEILGSAPPTGVLRRQVPLPRFEPVLPDVRREHEGVVAGEDVGDVSRPAGWWSAGLAVSLTRWCEPSRPFPAASTMEMPGIGMIEYARAECSRPADRDVE